MYLKVTNPKTGLYKYLLRWDLSAEDELKTKIFYARAGYKVEASEI